MTSDARQLAAEIDELKRAVRDLQLAARLGNSSIEGRPVEVYDDDGTLRQVTGLQGDGTYTSVDLNAPAPPVPADPSVLGGGGLLTITSYGMTADGSDWPLDFSHIEVHVGTTSGFIPSPATLVGTFGFDGGVLSVALDEGTYYCVLVAANTSGVVSATSGEKSGTVVAPATSAGGITTYYAETEPVGLGPSDEGSLWYDTSDGNRLHRWDGSLWFAVLFGGSALAADAVDGKTITGALIRTAALGERIEMDSAFAGRVRFFTGHPDEDPAFPGGIYVNSFDSVSGDGSGSILLMDMSAPRHVGSTLAPAHIEVREDEPVLGSGVFERAAIIAADRVQMQVDRVELGYTGSSTEVFLNGRQTLTPCYSRRYNDFYQGAPKGTWTRVSFNADIETTGLGFSGGVWQCWHPGVYLLMGSVAWTRDTINRREVRWIRNVDERVANSTVPATALDANDATHTVLGTVRLNLNDTVFLEAWQNSNVDPLGMEFGQALTWASITKIGE